MRSHELKRAKRMIRREMLALRDAMSAAEREELGGLVVERFLALAPVRAAGTVAAFWSFGSEVPTEPLLRGLQAAGTRTALPRIEAGELHLHAWAPGDPLSPTSFGALEPENGDPVDPREVDVICTPGVAFDTAGRRIGYGGGFYDRLFDACGDAAVRAAIAFDLQVVDDPLPQGHFDRRVQLIVTPTRVIEPPES